jgi:hypothetical protein
MTGIMRFSGKMAIPADQRSHERKRTKARFLLKVGLESSSPAGFCQ